MCNLKIRSSRVYNVRASEVAKYATETLIAMRKLIQQRTGHPRCPMELVEHLSALEFSNANIHQVWNSNLALPRQLQKATLHFTRVATVFNSTKDPPYLAINRTRL
ncbi:hypothetical protein L6452_41833 [Arctium lappa]|uniref:Uncharacterized protein n=1 Tax=Arctium lappa TaxID=4217 RepID=A0ACB8XKN3_ARCLA|nr:hypothetical protein L6452_41833 [Arctium lappa]